MSELGIYKPKAIVETENVTAKGTLSDLMKAAKEQCDLAFGAYRKSVEHVWSMGQLLSEAHDKHRVLKHKKGKDQPNWDELLKRFGISVASDNRARRLFKNCESLEEIDGLSITEAYEAAGIPKSHPRTPQPASREECNESGHALNASKPKQRTSRMPAASNTVETADAGDATEITAEVEKASKPDPDSEVNESCESPEVDDASSKILKKQVRLFSDLSLIEQLRFCEARINIVREKLESELDSFPHGDTELISSVLETISKEATALWLWFGEQL